MEIQWPLVLFTLLTSMGGCLFAFIGLNEFTKKSDVDGFVPGIIAGVLAIVGGFCSVLHLAHPERIMNALSHPTSGIFIEALLVGCLVVCIAVYLICLKREAAKGVKVFAVLGAVFGLALSFMAGHSYIMEAIEMWDTMLLPTGYLLTALPMGSSLYWALAGKSADSSKFMATCTLVCGALGLIGAAAYAACVGGFAGSTFAFAAGAVVLAGVVPAALGGVGMRAAGDGSRSALAWTSFASATVGALLFRMLMWALYASAFGFFGAL